MTYRDLLHRIAEFSEEQMNADVTICQDNGEMFAADLWFSEEDDILDRDHPYLEVVSTRHQYLD